MATTNTATVDISGTPKVTVTERNSDVTSAKVYTAEVEFLELDPKRGTTSEERSAGISSLAPPTVQASEPRDLIRLAIRACGSSFDATDGFTMGASIYYLMSIAVAHGVQEALRELGVDV